LFKQYFTGYGSVRIILSQLYKLTNFRNVDITHFKGILGHIEVILVDNNNSVMLKLNKDLSYHFNVKDYSEQIMRIEEMYPGLFRSDITKDIDELKLGDAKALEDSSKRGGNRGLSLNRKKTAKRK